MMKMVSSTKGGMLAYAVAVWANIAGQHSIYLFNQFMAFRQGQHRHPEMRSLARELNDQELNELIIYYSKLPRH
jgi:cytochrome c553